jgi:5-methylcytosine-specific restriction endonuclease McrA
VTISLFISEKEELLFHFNTSRHKYEGICENCWQTRRKEYCAKNLERNNAGKKKWAENNINSVAASKKKWKEENIGKVKADKARRKTQLELATPKWLSQWQLEAIDHSYLVAELRTQCFGEEYQVDHIIPIRGKNVCGLNVPWNLEVIKKSENLKKGNKLLPWRVRG